MTGLVVHNFDHQPTAGMRLTFGNLLELLEEDDAEHVEGHLPGQGGDRAPEEPPGPLQLGGHADGLQHVAVSPGLQPLLDDLARDADAGAQEGPYTRRQTLQLQGKRSLRPQRVLLYLSPSASSDTHRPQSSGSRV